jgi:hypothetical protein
MFIPDDLGPTERRMWEQLAEQYDDKLLKRLLGLERRDEFDTDCDPGDETQQKPLSIRRR